jgi:hypothetical protein
MQFLDIATSENFKIVDIVRCTSTRGAGSKKLFYKMYDLVKFPGSPISFLDFEHQPCAEVISSTDTRWDDTANNVSLIAMSAAFPYHDAHREHFHNLTWGEESFCANYADFHQSPLFQANRADFLDSLSQPPPKNVTSARVHPEAVNYISARSTKSWLLFIGAAWRFLLIYLSEIFHQS